MSLDQTEGGWSAVGKVGRSQNKPAASWGKINKELVKKEKRGGSPLGHSSADCMMVEQTGYRQSPQNQAEDRALGSGHDGQIVTQKPEAGSFQDSPGTC